MCWTVFIFFVLRDDLRLGLLVVVILVQKDALCKSQFYFIQIILLILYKGFLLQDILCSRNKFCIWFLDLLIHDDTYLKFCKREGCESKHLNRSVNTVKQVILYINLHWLYSPEQVGPGVLEWRKPRTRCSSGLFNL